MASKKKGGGNNNIIGRKIASPKCTVKSNTNFHSALAWLRPSRVLAWTTVVKHD